MKRSEDDLLEPSEALLKGLVKSFAKAHGREPKSLAEVREWFIECEDALAELDFDLSKRQTQ